MAFVCSILGSSSEEKTKEAEIRALAIEIISGKHRSCPVPFSPFLFWFIMDNFSEFAN